jgi:hypothetical protein
MHKSGLHLLELCPSVRNTLNTENRMVQSQRSLLRYSPRGSFSKGSDFASAFE